MENYFCSLITKSHIVEILSTFYTLYRYNNNYKLFLLIIDNNEDENKIDQFKIANFILFNNSVTIINLNDILKSDELYFKIYNKYSNYVATGNDSMRKKNNKNDIIRYSTKVSLISYLLNYKNIENVIWIDCDLYFIKNVDDIFDTLKTKEVVLTPHFRNTNDEKKRHLVFSDGFFNVGFIGFNKSSICLKWYIEQIYFTCDVIYGYYYYEQKYLDYFPVLTDNVEILRNGNYNISEWNIDTCIREEKNNQLYINNKKVVFFHFTNHYINLINNGEEIPIVNKYLNEYFELQKYISKNLN